VGGRAYLILEGEEPPWLSPFFRNALSEVNLGPERKLVPDGRRLYGLNLTYRKSEMERHGGFRVDLDRIGGGLLGGGETELVRRIAEAGGKVYYDPDVVVGHLIGPERLEWEYFKRYAAGQGRTSARVEPPADASTRLIRVARGLAYLSRSLLQAVWRRVLRRDPCERKMADSNVVHAKALTAERWRLLCGVPVDPEPPREAE
jgi:hypothetical protein